MLKEQRLTRFLSAIQSLRDAEVALEQSDCRSATDSLETSELELIIVEQLRPALDSAERVVTSLLHQEAS